MQNLQYINNISNIKSKISIRSLLFLSAYFRMKTAIFGTLKLMVDIQQSQAIGWPWNYKNLIELCWLVIRVLMQVREKYCFGKDFECPHAIAIWFNSSLQLRSSLIPHMHMMDCLDNLYQFLIKQQDGAPLVKMAGSLMGHIWKDRNMFIFEGKQKVALEVIRLAYQ